MRKIYIFSLAFFVLVSCNRVPQEKSGGKDKKSTLRLIESSIVKFPLDHSTSYTARYISTLIDTLGKELLVFLSHDKPSILFYDIATQLLVKEIPLTKEGPNGVGNPYGLLIQSLDSIYVVASSRYMISLINSDGVKLKNYRTLEGDKYNDNTGMLRPYTSSPPVKLNDQIYFNVAPDRNVFSPEYFDGHVNLVLDTKTGDYKYFNKYPDKFKGGVWGAVGAFSVSSTFNGEEFIYSFAISDSLVRYNPKTLSIRTHFAGSKYVEPIRPMTKPDENHDLEYALETPYYYEIIYDKYRDVYYRFVHHSLPFKDELTGEINDFFEKPVSVIILNNNFEIIEEKMLTNNKFLTQIHFLTPSGLFISNNNPNNPDLEEDYAVFTCFKLVNNEEI